MIRTKIEIRELKQTTTTTATRTSPNKRINEQNNSYARALYKSFYYIDTDVLLKNIPLVKFIKNTSGTRLFFFFIISHVSLSMISLISSLSLVLKFVGVSSKHLRVFLESLRQSSEIFGHLRKFSDILGKCSGAFVLPSEQF